MAIEFTRAPASSPPPREQAPRQAREEPPREAAPAREPPPPPRESPRGRNVDTSA
jgi:hypothetical protein